MLTVLVPVSDEPKARLAWLLARDERIALSERLLDDVLAALDGFDVRLVRGRGLNASLEAAMDTSGPPWLVVPSDLYGLTRPHVDALLAEPGDVVVGAASDGGTNALLLRRRIPLRFGAGSALAHARAAREAGMRVRVVGFAVDLDGDADLVRSGNAAGAPLRRAPAWTSEATSSWRTSSQPSWRERRPSCPTPPA